MGITQSQVDRIKALRSHGLTLRQIGERMGLSHDTVGKVIRGERGATRGQDGRMIKRAGGKPEKPKFSEMLPRSNREKALADYWYDRGVWEAKQMDLVAANDRHVEIRVG